ncbi:hypothetical protein [Streptomyces sp. NBC_01465]|uniref:hypothetical protein n=1 Tax=Streptomyces sp. NBC_01465 TaxID=2903878 RepID=UPI002E369B8A|nr:hypothetical protein [Streptomyces sp. NBC_01465]
MKRTTAVTVVAVLAVAAVVTFLTELDSSRNDAKYLGAAAFTAGIVFYALGWAKKDGSR